MEFRIEKDTMGEIKVPADKLWGAQTQRSYENFRIGDIKMPSEIISAFASLKKACARENGMSGRISEEKAVLINHVCDEILAGKLRDSFPLSVFQTGSGTQSNMNVNEVIANRGNMIAGKKILHPLFFFFAFIQIYYSFAISTSCNFLYPVICVSVINCNYSNIFSY